MYPLCLYFYVLRENDGRQAIERQNKSERGKEEKECVCVRKRERDNSENIELKDLRTT